MKADQVRPFSWPTSEPDVAAVSARVPTPGTAVAPPTPTPDTTESTPTLPDGIEPGSIHAYMSLHAAEAAAVLRTMMQRNDPCATDEALAGLSARQVAAAFLAGLGIDVGAQVMRHLADVDEARWVGCALAQEPRVTHRVAMAALNCVRGNIEAGEYLEEGGMDYATRLFETAFYRGKVPGLLSPEGEAVTGYDAFRYVDPDQLAPYLAHEHPQTTALFLSQLQPAQGANILSRLSTRLQADVAYRMATLQQVDPETLTSLGNDMHGSYCDVLGVAETVGGYRALADLLNLTGSSTRKNVLDQIDAQDPEVSEAVAKCLFTFADLDGLRDRELQVVLREVDQKDLVVSLKACHDDLRQRILQNMSDETRIFMQQEMELLGPMRLSEAEEVMQRIARTVRQLDEQGQLTIVRGDDTDTVWI